MIGSGIPINQSNAPFPKPIVASIESHWTGNARGFHWFHMAASIPDALAGGAAANLTQPSHGAIKTAQASRGRVRRLFQPVLWGVRRLLVVYFTLRLQPKIHLRAACLAALLPKLVSALSNFILQTTHDLLQSVGRVRAWRLAEVRGALANQHQRANAGRVAWGDTDPEG